MSNGRFALTVALVVPLLTGCAGKSESGGINPGPSGGGGKNGTSSIVKNEDEARWHETGSAVSGEEETIASDANGSYDGSGGDYSSSIDAPAEPMMERAPELTSAPADDRDGGILGGMFETSRPPPPPVRSPGGSVRKPPKSKPKSSRSRARKGDVADKKLSEGRASGGEADSLAVGGARGGKRRGVSGSGSGSYGGGYGGGYIAPVVAPAMKAGRHDDNKQYNRFLSFLAENDHLVEYKANIDERLIVRLRDKDGKSMHNCRIEIKNLSGRVLSRTTSYADGSTQFFPMEAASPGDKEFTVRATCGSKTRNGQLKRYGKRESELRFTVARSIVKHVPVDIAIVLDTTGSMQSQIDRLKKTLKAIHFQLTQLSTRPDIRFALVAYRDRGDDYITRPYQFTSNVRHFQKTLDSLDADGGGDTPEDLQAGLDDAMHKLDWRENALRIGFIVADAIPHTDYGQKYTYLSVMHDSLERGIKWIGVGAGGLPRKGEVTFRQIAQYTMGEYVFITQGGTGDREGGVGEASHHVGSNYSTENLDQAMVRIVRRELSYLTDNPKDFDETIVATASSKVPRDKVLAPAVAEVLRQLGDYSAMKLVKGTRVGIIPCKTKKKAHNDVAEYITEQMVLSASRNPYMKLVEKDMQHISKEVRRQLTDVFDVEKSVAIGRLLGAEVLIVSKLMVHERGASLFAKLVRVETGEILSVAKVDMNANVVNAS